MRPLLERAGAILARDLTHDDGRPRGETDVEPHGESEETSDAGTSDMQSPVAETPRQNEEEPRPDDTERAEEAVAR